MDEKPLIKRRYKPRDPNKVDKRRNLVKKPPGRPPKEIDWKKVDELLEAGCLGTEIAACFGMFPTTFYSRVEKEKGMVLSEYLQLKKSKGDARLRAKQYVKAINGDNTLLLWLGKNRLGQADQHNHEHNIVVQTISYKDAEIDDDSNE